VICKSGKPDSCEPTQVLSIWRSRWQRVETDIDNGLQDDSDVPVHAVIDHIIKNIAPTGYVIGVGGGFEAEAEAESLEAAPLKEIDGVGDKELGRGKRRKHANRLYSNLNFWRHNDDSND
jgi:hypothetical protein